MQKLAFLVHWAKKLQHLAVHLRLLTPPVLGICRGSAARLAIPAAASTFIVLKTSGGLQRFWTVAPVPAGRHQGQ